MANPTTNFGWQMPTSTDLVTDLPADFATFGQAVDTSMADLKGGTTGQVLSKNSNTDMDFVWTAATSGDITGVSVTSPITGGGTSGDVTIGISSSAVVPSQTGNSGKYLTTDGTTSSWGTVSAGGMTLLSTTTLTGTSVTISSISQDYKHLLIIVKNAYCNAGTDDVYFQLNGITTSSYGFRQTQNTGGTLTAAAVSSTTQHVVETGSNTDFSNKHQAQIWIYRYTDSANVGYHSNADGYSGSAKINELNSGVVNNSSGISSIKYYLAGGSTWSSGTLYIYGVS